MYNWDVATPWRDGDLEGVSCLMVDRCLALTLLKLRRLNQLAGIVIHEFAHGLSTRLTGGPANSGCLGWGEAGGMGEGWGDYFATQINYASIHKKHGDFPMGAWSVLSLVCV